MAAAVKNSANAVYGSLAYDFESTLAYPEESIGARRQHQEERRVVIPAPPVVKDRVAEQTRVKTRQGVAPLAMIGLACAAVLLVFSLMARIRLTQVTDQAVQLEQQLEDLKLTQARLLIDYESAFNLSKIEEYAKTKFGMQRPRNEQIYYINSTVPDKAVVIDAADDERSLGDRIFDMLASIGEYFK